MATADIDFEYFRSHADDQWWLPTSQLLFARVPEFVWGPIWKWSKIYSTVRQTVNTTLNGWPPPCTEQRNMKYFLEKSVCQCISRRWLRGLFITPCQVGETGSDIRSTPPIKVPLISPFFPLSSSCRAHWGAIRPFWPARDLFSGEIFAKVWRGGDHGDMVVMVVWSWWSWFYSRPWYRWRRQTWQHWSLRWGGRPEVSTVYHNRQNTAQIPWGWTCPPGPWH